MYNRIILSLDSSETSAPIIDVISSIFGHEEADVTKLARDIFQSKIEEYCDEKHIVLENESLENFINEEYFYHKGFNSEDQEEILYELFIMKPNLLRKADDDAKEFERQTT